MNIPKHDFVKLSPDDARRVNLKIQEQFEQLNTMMNITQAAANTIAGKCLCDAHERLAKHPVFRQPQVRRYANLAKRKYYEYEKLHTSNFGDRYQMFLDYLDAVEDIINPHLQILRLAVKRVLDKHAQTDTDLKAAVEVALVMLDFSCRAFDNTLRDTRESTGRDFTKYMRPARLSGCLSFWRNVVEDVCFTPKGEPDIDLNADADVALALKVVGAKLSDPDTLNRAGYEALKLNSELIERYVGDDFNELAEKYEN